jgi:competence protein ComEA
VDAVSPIFDDDTFDDDTFDDDTWTDDERTENERVLAQSGAVGQPMDAPLTALPPPGFSPTGAIEQENASPTRTWGFSPLALALHVLLNAFLIGVALMVLRRPDPPPIALQPPPTPAPTATATPLPTPAPIAVYVSGAVRNPAVYELPTGARVADALALAGGLTAEADAARINQAEPLFDGAQVHVPLIQSEQNIVPASQPDAGVSGSAPTGGSAANAGSLVNVNTASIDELTTLPGIGPSKAANIVASRPYATVDDLERASGIGAKTVDRLRDLVTVQ